MAGLPCRPTARRRLASSTSRVSCSLGLRERCRPSPSSCWPSRASSRPTWVSISGTSPTLHSSAPNRPMAANSASTGSAARAPRTRRLCTCVPRLRWMVRVWSRVAPSSTSVRWRSQLSTRCAVRVRVQLSASNWPSRPIQSSTSVRAKSFSPGSRQSRKCRSQEKLWRLFHQSGWSTSSEKGEAPPVSNSLEARR